MTHTIIDQLEIYLQPIDVVWQASVEDGNRIMSDDGRMTLEADRAYNLALLLRSPEPIALNLGQTDFDIIYTVATNKRVLLEDTLNVEPQWFFKYVHDEIPGYQVPGFYLIPEDEIILMENLRFSPDESKLAFLLSVPGAQKKLAYSMKINVYEEASTPTE